jgi:hypothetical protein
VAAGNTYVAIATETLASAAASVTFSSIPSTYTDLVLVVNANTATDTQIRLQFNGDTGSNYSATMVSGDGSSPFTVQVSNETSMNAAGVGITSGSSIFHINNYANTTTFKTSIGRYNLGSTSYGEIGIKMGLWRSTSAITSIVIFPTSGNFNTGGTFNLYGIKAA